MNHSDETLMLEFQSGSRAAFDELFARYRSPLYGFFQRRLATAARAEDLMQETFLAVIRAASHYEPKAPFRTYLYAIAMKLLFAERRKQARTGLARPTESAVFQESDAALWVRQAIEKLDDREREILMLREYEQLSYDEIATLLALPLNSVRSRLFRARIALKQLLEPVQELT